MIFGPSIYVEFYYRFVKDGVACARIGGGALTDVLEAVKGPGICVLSSLVVTHDCPIMRMGRATVDLEANTITQNELRDLDRDGASFWLFWHGTRLTSRVAHYLSSRPQPAGGASVTWVELDQDVPSELADEQAARERMEFAWTMPMPHGPVIIRFQGAADDLLTWSKAQD